MGVKRVDRDAYVTFNFHGDGTPVVNTMGLHAMICVYLR